MHSFKFTVALLFTVLIQLSSFGQMRDLEIFSGGGEKFILFFNGVQQTAEPVTNVKVTDIAQEFVNVRIVFEDVSKGEISKNFPLSPNTLTSGQIKLSKKGVYKIAYMGEVPLASASPNSQQVVSTYSTTPVESTTTTTKTTVTNSGTDPNMNVAMNVGGTGISVNMTGLEGSYTETTTSTTTTTTQSSSSNGSSGDIECVSPMASTKFAEAKKSIESKSFEDSKLMISKQVAQANCLSTNQVKEIMGLFGFEETKLEFAKYAYTFTYDKGNYYRVNDAFTFEASMEELNEFLGK